MTEERARQIADEIWNNGGCHAPSMTKEEKAEILKVWDRLPSWTTFFDAVRHIAEGFEEKEK